MLINDNAYRNNGARGRARYSGLPALHPCGASSLAFAILTSRHCEPRQRRGNLMQSGIPSSLVPNSGDCFASLAMTSCVSTQDSGDCFARNDATCFGPLPRYNALFACNEYQGAKGYVRSRNYAILRLFSLHSRNRFSPLRPPR